MNTLRKVVASLLISTVLFVFVVFVAYSGAFSFLEVNFYQPRVERMHENNLKRVAEYFSLYYDEVNEIFADYLVQDEVDTYIEPQASEKDRNLRRSLSGYLFVRINGLQGIRLVESDGTHVHYSTFESDILYQTDEVTSYRNYGTLGELSWKLVQAPDEGVIADTVEKIMASCHLYLDSTRNRFVFSYPLFDSYTAYRGTFVFYVSADDFTSYLLMRNAISLNDRAVIVGEHGIVMNLPVVGRGSVVDGVINAWAQNKTSATKIVEGAGPDGTWFLTTGTYERLGINFGSVDNLHAYSVSEGEKLLLLLSVAASLFLLIFMILNVRHDDMVIVQNRIRKFQFAMLKTYIERKDYDEWAEISREVAKRKMDVNEELKKSLGRRGEKYSLEIDEMLDEAWRDIIAVFGVNTGANGYVMPPHGWGAAPYGGGAERIAPGTAVLSAAAVATPAPAQGAEVFASSRTLPASDSRMGQSTIVVPAYASENSQNASPFVVQDVTPPEAMPLIPVESGPDEVKTAAGAPSVAAWQQPREGALVSSANELADLESIFSVDGPYLPENSAAGVPEGELEPLDEEGLEPLDGDGLVPVEDDYEGAEPEEPEALGMGSLDAIAAFINRAREEVEAESGGGPVEEVSIEDYMRLNSILKPGAKSSEKEKEESPLRFKVLMPDYSALDPS